MPGANDATNGHRLLAGLRVIDYSHFLAGSHVGRCLAALGAEVIKVERPTEGDPGRQHPLRIAGYSGYFLQQNMGKRGLCVDLRDRRGLELMLRLVDRADVFIENYRPGALARIGLGQDALRARNPALVYCSISAFGHTGPDAHRAGFGLIAEARSGIMQMVGTPYQSPPLLRIALADMYTGTYAVAAINAALFDRTRTGRGQHVDLALYDSLVSMHEYAVQCYTLSGGRELPQRTGHDLPNSTLYGVFPAIDGDVVIAAQVGGAWQRLAALIEAEGGPPGFGSDARFADSLGRNLHRVEILCAVEQWAATRTVAEALSALERSDVPAAKVQRIDEVLKDPQVCARGMVTEQHHPALGSLHLANLPFRFSDAVTSFDCVAPDLGQHNAEIAGSLGFSAEEIEAMQSDGVLYQPQTAPWTDTRAR